MDQVIDQIIDIATELYNQLSELLGDYLLLAAGLGLCILLILILLISRRKRTRRSRGDGDIEFLEVGPEPVIVYRRSEQNAAEETPINDQPEQASTPPLDKETEAEAPAEIAETEEAPVMPERETPETPDEHTQDLQAPVSQPVLDLPEIPVAQPVLDPEPMPDAEPDPPPQDSPPNQIQLPNMQSELAHDTLKLFSEQGFNIEKIVYQGIYGADFIASRPGIRIYVQIKALRKNLANYAISEVSSYAMNHDCNSSVIVSTAKFSRSAVKAATRLNVFLWNKKSLKKYQDQPIFPHLDQTVAAKSE